MEKLKSGKVTVRKSYRQEKLGTTTRKEIAGEDSKMIEKINNIR